MKIVVIGINHAGTKAVQTLRAKFPQHKVVCYDQNNNISFLACGIALWIKNIVKNPNMLFYASKASLESLGAEIHEEVKLEKLDPKTKTLYLYDLKTNKTFTDNYDKLILGIGSWPAAPTWTNLNLKGIYFCKLYQQAEAIINNLKQPTVKHVVIIGAGYIGSELAEAIHCHQKQVTLIDALPTMLHSYYDLPLIKMVQERYKANHINLVMNTRVTGFVGDNQNQVKAVKTNDKTIKSDMVIIAIGSRPNTKILNKAIALDQRGAVITNEYFQTSDPDIYAVGDDINIFSSAAGCFKNIGLATNAIRSGIAAAINVATNNSFKFPGVQGSNAIKLFDLHLASTGLNESEARALNYDYQVVEVVDNDKPEFMNHYHQVYFRVLYETKTKRILGAQIGSEVSHSEAIYLMSLVINKGLTINELPFIDLFFLPHENKPINFITLAGLKALGLETLATNFNADK